MILIFVMFCALIGIGFLYVDEILILFRGLQDKKQRRWMRIVGLIMTGLFSIWFLLVFLSLLFAPRF